MKLYVLRVLLLLQVDNLLMFMVYTLMAFLRNDKCRFGFLDVVTEENKMDWN